MGNQLTKNYDVSREPTTFGGLGSPWKVHSATCHDKVKTPVSIFLLDKKPLDGKKDKNEILEKLKSEPSVLSRLRHPGILRIVETVLEDNKTVAFVTEPVSHCLGELLRRPQCIKATLCDLEVRLGLLDLIQAISFLHTEARLVHFCICPENIYLTPSGKWKLSGLGFAGTLNQEQVAQLDSSVDIVLAAKNTRFDAQNATLAPLLHFSSHELVRDNRAGPSADIFALGCSIYAIYRAIQDSTGEGLLLEVDEFSVNGHRSGCSRIGRTPSVNLGCLPEELCEKVLKMVSFTESERCSLHELSTCRAFQSSFVRAIYYLEHLHEKQDSQKLDFFQGLAKIIGQFDAFILQKRILPALIQNMQHPSLSVYILPNLISIIKTLSLDKEYFQVNI